MPFKCTCNTNGCSKKTDIKLRKVLNCDATNIIINNGKEAGQEVPHLHIHIIPRYSDDNLKLSFNHESYKKDEMKKLKKKEITILIKKGK